MKSQRRSLAFITILIAVLTVVISIVVNFATNIPGDWLPPLGTIWIVLGVLIIGLVVLMFVYQKKEEQIESEENSKIKLDKKKALIGDHVEWDGLAQDISNFYGRESELIDLEH